MTVADIKALATGGESETVELKASTGERVAGATAACAMLNHRGGTVLFGVQPDRHVSGQTDKTNLSRTGRSTISIAPRSFVHSMKRFGVGGQRIPEPVIRRSCCADSA